MTTDNSEMRRPIAIDLFCGCGGLSLGFEEAGFDIKASVEIDPVHAAVHEFNFPYAKTICSDISVLSGKDILEKANIAENSVDVVIGGAPCQGFSLIGKRSFDDPRNKLVAEFVRVVGEIKPKYCVLENVKGLTIGEHKKFLSDVIEELQKHGYNVLLPYKVLNASDYGVPQNRERLFLIGARSDIPLPTYPEKLGEKVTVGEAIEDLPDADHFSELLKNDRVFTHWETKSDYARKLRRLSDDAKDFSYPRNFDKDLLTASTRTTHTEVSKQRFSSTPQGEVEKKSRFLRLSLKGQSNTLRAGTDSARGAFTSPRPIHPIHPRVITVREAARIHSYPDWFCFNKTKWHGFREIGNSVPPLLARAVGQQIIKALGISPTKPKQVLKTGPESLLEMKISSAAQYFNVPKNVIAQRTRKNGSGK